jgi:tRNA-specific 2-thiouridylase
VRVTGPDSAEITALVPLRAVTPGQSAVLYDEDLVVGGGTIRRTAAPATAGAAA